MPDYPMYLDCAKVTRKSAVAALREDFPSFTKSTMSMVCHPEDYGVQLTKQAERTLCNSFGWHVGLAIRRGQGRKENRAKANRLTLRLDDAMNARLDAFYERSAFASKQDLLEAALLLFLNRCEGVSV